AETIQPTQLGLKYGHGQQIARGEQRKARLITTGSFPPRGKNKSAGDDAQSPADCKFSPECYRGKATEVSLVPSADGVVCNFVGSRLPSCGLYSGTSFFIRRRTTCRLPCCAASRMYPLQVGEASHSPPLKSCLPGGRRFLFR
ncbi:MAG: hypothetical protein HW412_2445, partial [Bacteroidetes bacterium]|nr:hypothetical protein [Bacteroidota bacterium]